MAFDSLESGVPYIVGAMTNFEFVKMEPFGNYMFLIDPDQSKVKNNS